MTVISFVWWNVAVNANLTEQNISCDYFKCLNCEAAAVWDVWFAFAINKQAICQILTWRMFNMLCFIVAFHIVAFDNCYESRHE